MTRRLLPLFRSSGGIRYLPLAVMRFAFGLFFFASGFNKLVEPANQALMLETLTEAGIPFPEPMAVIVAGCETLFGMMVALGLATRLGAVVLMTISLVALLTVGLGQIPPGLAPLAWYSWLMYLPESGYILMSALLIALGSGPLGIDRWITRRLEGL